MDVHKNAPLTPQGRLMAGVAGGLLAAAGLVLLPG